MKLVTRQELANGVAERWKLAYCNQGKWPAARRETYERLVALGAMPDPDQVDEIVGSGAWTHRLCDACSNEVAEAVQIISLAGAIIDICQSCAAIMVGLFADGEGE